MKNLIIVISILLTVLLLGCTEKGVYVGDLKDGKLHGQVIYTHSDGRKYVGEWKDGYRTGQGTFSTTFGFNFKNNIHSSLSND